MDAPQNLYGCTTKFVWMPCVKKTLKKWHKKCTELAWMHKQISLDTQNKFVWMHNKTCKDAQQNLYGCTKKFIWMHCVKKTFKKCHLIFASPLWDH